MMTVTRAPSDPATEAWRLMMQLVWAQRGRFIESVGELGLSPMQAHALRFLERPVPMSELAETLWCDASNVTGIVDRLEARGLVERRPSPDDRRVKLLRLTDEGETLRARVVERMERPAPELAALGADEQRQLRDLLARALGH
jgi:MarR family transcriptional regulator, organic hydroperoxide resistance regulator